MVIMDCCRWYSLWLFTPTRSWTTRVTTILIGLLVKTNFYVFQQFLVRLDLFYLLDYGTWTEIFQIGDWEKHKNKNHRSQI